MPTPDSAHSGRVFGFQCHIELTREVVVERLIAHSETDLTRAAKYRFVDTPDVLRAHDDSQMNTVLFSFLDKLAKHYQGEGSAGFLSSVLQEKDRRYQRNTRAGRDET